MEYNLTLIESRRCDIRRLRELASRIRSLRAQARARIETAAAALRRFLSRKSTRRALRIGGLTAAAALLSLSAAFFIFRNAILRSVLDGKLQSYRQANPAAVVEIGKTEFRGLAGIEVERISLRFGTLALDVDRCAVTAAFWKMLVGQVRLKNLTLDGFRVALKAQSTAPAAGPGKRKNPAEKAVPPARLPDYGAGIGRFLDICFTRIPDRLVINRVFIHTAFDGIRQALYVPRLNIGGPTFETTLDVFDQGKKWPCVLAGGIERAKRRLAFHLRSEHGLPLPFLERQWGLKAGFDALTADLQSRGRRNNVLRLEGSLAVSGLALNHQRIAGADVNVERAALDFSLRVGPDYFELAPPTRVSFNRMAFQPQIGFSARPSRRLTVRIPATRFGADDLFTSLPAGLFTRLAGIRTSGELDFHLYFAIDFSRPDKLELDVDLEKRGFTIRRFGAANLRHFAGPFLYTAYEKDRPVRSFVVGPENPSFRFLEQIPPFLKHAVMISEDGAFFGHRGFLLDPFKKSIAANLRAGRFVRGASTISMQLVKNLYLRRHKTIARKLEELLITWLIEENRLVSKERMLETYLNIIEWGPGVYGAQEAARYYFEKDVEGVTLAEAIFMAAIVPRPKRFMWFFDDDRRLRPWLHHYYADVSRKMLARGWISQADFDTLVPDVTLTGPAKFLLKGAEAEIEEAAEEEGWIIGEDANEWQIPDTR